MKKLLTLALLFSVVSCAQAQSNGGFPPPVTTTRSASYYLYLPTAAGAAGPVSPEEMLANEQIDFPNMAAYGFNTVYLVEFRSKFDPLLDNQYNREGIANLRMELEAARQNGLRVFLGLNFGSGYQIGIDSTPEALLARNAKFQSWLQFVQYLLMNIDDYRDMVYPIVFEEGQADATYNLITNADAAARAFQQTLGNLPALLPAALRAKWTFGWYGATTALYSHTPAQVGFDWVGEGAYFFDPTITLSWLAATDKGLTDAQISAKLEDMFGKVGALYPGMPIVFTEGGYYTCSSETFNRQGEVYALLAEFAISRGYGLNLWGYRSLLTPEQECAERGGKGGHSMGNADGSPRPAMLAVSAAITGHPTEQMMFIAPLPGGRPEPRKVERHGRD